MRRNVASSESSSSVGSSDTVYPVRFSARILPLRSVMMPRGAGSEMGRNRFVSDCSWYFEWSRICVRKNTSTKAAPAASTRARAGARPGTGPDGVDQEREQQEIGRHAVTPQPPPHRELQHHEGRQDHVEAVLVAASHGVSPLDWNSARRSPRTGGPVRIITCVTAAG